MNERAPLKRQSCRRHFPRSYRDRRPARTFQQAPFFRLGRPSHILAKASERLPEDRSRPPSPDPTAEGKLCSLDRSSYDPPLGALSFPLLAILSFPPPSESRATHSVSHRPALQGLAAKLLSKILFRLSPSTQMKSSQRRCSASHRAARRARTLRKTRCCDVHPPSV